MYYLLHELKYEIDTIVPDVVECYNGKSIQGLHILPSDMECVFDKVHNKHWWGHRFDEDLICCDRLHNNYIRLGDIRGDRELIYKD